MKKVVTVTETEMILDDDTVVELLFELEKPLTLEEAQEIYEESLKIRDSIVERKDREVSAKEVTKNEKTA